MTKEERAEMLALMQEALHPITERLDTLEKGQLTLEKNMLTFEQNQRNLEQNQRNTDMIIENEVNRAIKAIAEGHTILNRKMDKLIDLDSRVETLEHKVSAIEYMLKQA